MERKQNDKRPHETPDGSPTSPTARSQAFMTPVKLRRLVQDLPPLPSASVPLAPTPKRTTTYETPKGTPQGTPKGTPYGTPKGTPHGTPKTAKRMASRVLYANKITMIVQPPLHYGHDHVDLIGKLFVDPTMCEKEQQIIERLKQVDPELRHLLYAKEQPETFSVADKRLLMVVHQNSSFQAGLDARIEDWIRKGARRHEKRYRHDYPVMQLTMPYGGTPFSDIVAELSFSQLLKYAIQVAKGLQLLHRVSLVHQDLVPRNIVVSPKDDTARIIDFGLALSHQEVFDPDINEDRLETVYLAHPPEYHMTNQNDCSNYWHSLQPVRRAYMKLHALENKAAFLMHYNTVKEQGPRVFQKPAKVDIYSLGMILVSIKPRVPEDQRLRWLNLLKAMTSMNPNQRPTLAHVIQELTQMYGAPVMLSQPYQPATDPMMTTWMSPYKSIDSRRIRSKS